jgi:C4-dicarboxylate transporter/malic acid transport protein
MNASATIIDEIAAPEATMATLGEQRSFTDPSGVRPFGFIGPNWFASVMGTGIVAVALAGLPFQVPGSVAIEIVIWILTVLALVAVSVATILHWVSHPATARSHLDNPVMANFYGAPAMALMTVGVSTLLIGHRVIGDAPALAVDAVLWGAGTILGLATAVAVPYRAFTRWQIRDDAAFGGWLMPVVPPMVSAATGSALIPHLPAGQPQETMLVLCYLFFGLTLVTSLIIISFIWNRLIKHGVGAAAAVPTYWIVLGPLGQSVTAAHHLGQVAPRVLAAPYGQPLQVAAVLFGLPVLGFGLLWLGLAAALTLRTARRGLPFSLTWWSFTFPVGTMVTGTSGLAAVTGADLLKVLAGVLFMGLFTAWLIVSVRTVAGIRTGQLLLPPPQPVPTSRHN